MKRWYVVRTHALGEMKAMQHLSNQGFDVYLPRYRKQRRHARRIDVVLRPLFPRYLFVCLDVEMEQWRAINGTVGVSNIICNGDYPVPVPVGIIEDVQARENEDGAVILAPKAFTKGESLRITEGAFCEQVGLFDSMADDKRVFLLLDLMGRQVRITAPVEALAAAS